MSLFRYARRKSHEVCVGNIAIGGDNPVRLQSMASTSTMDTDASVAQAIRIANAGAELVRFTAQGVREAENLALIRQALRQAGCEVPLVADIHFNPRAAFAAAATVEKVRINPGNFVDPGRTFRKIEYTDSEYASELARLEEALVPFIETCRANDTAVRLGVNHGSLSDRIMSRFGDTPEGMVESAMEFLRVFSRQGFDRVVISIKASNVVVMVRTVLMLVRAMEAENMSYPLHLGVTEAGDGEDGRIKSALGIGTLLALGIGDTIRVSLSEEPECELPVAKRIVDYVDTFAEPCIESAVQPDPHHLPGDCNRYISTEVGGIGGGKMPVVLGADADANYAPNQRPDLFTDTADVILHEVAVENIGEKLPQVEADEVIVLKATSSLKGAPLRLLESLHAVRAAGVTNPLVVKMSYSGLSADEVTVRAAIDFGPLLLSGFADGIMIESDSLTPEKAASLSFAILQSARLRFTHTEFISCPGCGRTLFDLQSTVARVKAATSHLTGLKIGVMGCIVNGPGEMADADYGYVGAGVGKISLYKGRECIEKNIPADQAVERLVQLIKDCGDWK